jgi:phospholipid/cholesterol/gamma-HCH transport system substrate-binding protein
MDERGLGLRVGAVVLTSAVIFCLMIVMFLARGGAYLRDTYSVIVEFPRAPGVAEGTPVRKSGVEVGRVKSVELLDDGDVLVTLSLFTEIPLRANEEPRISTGSVVTGDAIIEFVRDTSNPTTDLLGDGDLITGKVMGDPIEVLVNLESRMTDTFASIQRAAAEIETAAATAGDILQGLEGLGDSRAQLLTVVNKAELALDQFSSTMTTIEQVFGDEALRARLHMAIEDLPTVVSEAKLLFTEGREAMQGFKSVSIRLDNNLANLEKFTEPLGERGPYIVENIDDSIRRLDEVFEQLVHMTTAINEEKGTLGKLLYDSEIYDNLNGTISEFDELTNVQVRAILDNIYIASDKIARDPFQFGVPGALRKSPSANKTILNIPR